MSSLGIKSDLRKKLLAQRKSLDMQDVAERSDQFVDQLMQKIDLADAQAIHVFLPLVDDKEPDLRPYIEHALEQDVGVYTSDPAPSTGRSVMPTSDALQQFDLDDSVKFNYIIVPMLGFDPKTNHRLGFGGGFYDRLIASQPKAKTIGICFKEFALDNLPVEPHDQRLDELLTA